MTGSSIARWSNGDSFQEYTEGINSWHWGAESCGHLIAFRSCIVILDRRVNNIIRLPSHNVYSRYQTCLSPVTLPDLSSTFIAPHAEARRFMRI